MRLHTIKFGSGAHNRWNCQYISQQIQSISSFILRGVGPIGCSLSRGALANARCAGNRLDLADQ